ncbi:ABC transporter permease [Bacillus spongiae]|uniref:ABC transporter permease n=1 Tax=Bacillus spongiae TaxID=2683610 RepID=A0ABU8HBJ4_9BACI
MIRFLWNSWWRNKERFILVIIGALIISTGLSYLVGITQANNGTVVDELQKRWNSSYHIVVRPEGTKSITEELNLLEPNYLSGIAGGISLEDYETIKSLESIDVAAPIAMVGNINPSIVFDQVNLDPGVYRLTIKEVTNTGKELVEEANSSSYVVEGYWWSDGLGKEYGVSRFGGDLFHSTNVMLAGIDPEAEAQLVGLDEAIISTDISRYFSKGDKVDERELDHFTETVIPVVISNKQFIDSEISFQIERLDLPFEGSEQAETMELVKENGGEEFLKKQKMVSSDTYTFTSDEMYELLLKEVLGEESLSNINKSQWIALKPSPVNFLPVTSPFSDRWPFAYELQTYERPADSLIKFENLYRPIVPYGSGKFEDWKRVRLNYLGVFDPQKLKVAKDPLTELPMETYFPSKASWVLDDQNAPINPPIEMKPMNNPVGFLTKPPLMLTTIEAAESIVGDMPISAIRVKVMGVDQFTENAQEILEKTAEEIRQKTGLLTDITLGSSPQPALTYIPEVEGISAIGWIEQPWVKLGSSISIFKEAKFGLSGVIGTVIAVAIVYVFSSNLIMMFARRKEFSVLLAMGWRRGDLSKLLFMESTILGIFVSIISWAILAGFYITNDINTSFLRVLLIGVFGLSVYWAGTLLPAILVRRITPYEGMRVGEDSKVSRSIVKVRSVFSLSLTYVLSKWKRSLLSVIAISLPTSLLVFYLFITFHLKGVMFATWLGQYVAMEVGPMHYIALVVALTIAILTTTEIIWQNISERQDELSLLKAIGWQNRSIRILVLLEGGYIGLMAGVVGMSFAMVIIRFMYGSFPTEQLFFLLSLMFIPVLTGIVGALFPAEKAVRQQSYEGLKGSAYSKTVSKKEKWIYRALAASLVVGIFVLLAQAVPEEGEKASNKTNEEETVVGTSGGLNQYEVEEVAADKTVEEDKEDKDIFDLLPDYILESGFDLLTFGESNSKYNYEELHVGIPQEAPKDLVAPKEGYEYLSFPIVFNAEEHYEGEYYKYLPQRFVIMDSEGNEYKAKEFTVLEKENWTGYEIIAPGGMTSLHTYEIPVDKNDLFLVIDYAGHDKRVIVLINE